MCRHDDPHPNKRFYRTSERVVFQNGQWFFMSREGEQGPYATEDEARMEAQRHVQACQTLIEIAEQRKKRDAHRRDPILEHGILANTSVTSLAILAK